MKKVFVVLFAAASLAACKQNTKTSNEAGQVAQASDSAATYTVDATASTLGWSGSKVVSGSHTGTINIQTGILSFENGELKSGNFTVDMKTIKNTDITDAAENAKLVGHLSSPDFFNVDSFPTATFEITKVEKLAAADANGNTHSVSGNLSIKNNTREITFPAKITTADGSVTATAKTEINRLEWNVMWGNEKDTKARAFLKENFLSNIIGININLVAKK